ncbi:MAG: copper chaperone PCu(A)C, partial [Alphaproteobacteria bacterium]
MPCLKRRALGALILALPASAALAHHDVTKGDIAIGHPWTRAAGANTNGAGFLTLRNNGAAPDRLISAASPAARVVELHTHIREGDVMRMRPVA